MMVVVLWLLIVFVITVMPSSEGSKIQHLDSVLHFIVYALTSALFIVELKKKIPLKKAMILAIVFASLYGFLMEAAQLFTATRSFSLQDGVANILGSIAGAVFVYKKITRK